VFTIGDLAEANLEASIRPFARYITAAPNPNILDADKEEKKRKRGAARRSSIGSSHMSVTDSGIGGSESPSKRVRNLSESIGETTGTGTKPLPKSLASLYESIMNAEKELEEGRRWDEDGMEEEL